MAITQTGGLPPKQGLYDPQFEHDACGVGFVVNVKGLRSNAIVRQALTVLEHLSHRGACGAEANTGDGAGILLQLPHKFFVKVAAQNGFTLPAAGEYGVGMLFLPKDAELRHHFEHHFAEVVQEEGQTLLGWRDVPTNNSLIGDSAKNAEPCMRQVFIGRNAAALIGNDALAFERKLYVIRKRVEQYIRYNNHNKQGHLFYVASLSSRTLVYKGMLMSEQVVSYYPD